MNVYFFLAVQAGKSQSSGDDVVWPSSCLPLFVSTPFWYCVLMYIFFFQVEVPPPTTGRTLEEEAIIAPSIGFPSVEDEAPSNGITEGTGQPIQGVQSTLSVIPSAT